MSAYPGINHGDVDPFRDRLRAFDARESFVAICYVADDDVSFASSGSYAIRYVAKCVLATSHEDDSRTIASCVLRDRATDAR